MKKSKNLESLKSEVFHLDGNQLPNVTGGYWWLVTLHFKRYDEESKIKKKECGVLIDDNNTIVAEKF